MASVADVIDEAASVEPVEELAVAVVVEVAIVAEQGHDGPIVVFARNASRTNFEQDRSVAVVAEQRARKLVRQKIEAIVTIRRTALELLDEKLCVTVGAEEISGMQMAFAP